MHALALVLSSLIGLEREFRAKTRDCAPIPWLESLQL
jgi:hypothetical protein